MKKILSLFLIIINVPILTHSTQKTFEKVSEMSFEDKELFFQTFQIDLTQMEQEDLYLVFDGNEWELVDKSEISKFSVDDMKFSVAKNIPC